MTKLAERLLVRLALFGLIATIFVWYILSSAGSFNEFRDAQVIALHEHAAVDAVRRFGQLPLWNPWYCGGLHGLGEPQSRFLSPTFLFSLVFGVERAEPLVVFFFAVLGMEGTYAWLRLRVQDAAAALRVAPIFALSGYFAVSLFRGWTNFFGFELLPWVLFGVTLAARGRMAGVVASALAFFVLLGFGGTFAAPIVAVAVALEAARALYEQPREARGRATGMLALAASFMLAVSAVRLLPLVETLTAIPRIMAGTPGHTLSALYAFVTTPLRVQGGDVTDVGSFYVGGASFLVLAAMGVLERRARPALIIVVALVWLAAGYARQPSLFGILRHVPAFSALRYPERFLWVAVLYGTELAAHASSLLVEFSEGRRSRLLAEALLTLAVVVTIRAEIVTFARVASERTLGALAEQPAPDFHQARGNRWLAAHVAGLGVGSLSCWETHPIAMSSKLRSDLPAEEYVADAATGAAKRIAWSPNRIDVHASMQRAGRLLINQNWHPGWRASAGTVVSDEGLLAVDLPAGEHDVAVTFRPRSAVAGACVTLSALAALAALVWRARRSRGSAQPEAYRYTAAFALAPWIVFGAFELTWSEPRFPPTVARNANGAPAVIDAPSSEATPIGARYALPITIEAAKVTGPDELRNVAVELVLRRTGSLPRSTGLFVHLRRSADEPAAPPSTQAYFNADHQVVASSFYLSDAPLDAHVLDAFGVHVGNAAPGRFDVLVGAGPVGGAQGRTKVVEPGNALMREDMVLVGSFTVR